MGSLLSFLALCCMHPTLATFVALLLHLSPSQPLYSPIAINCSPSARLLKSSVPPLLPSPPSLLKPSPLFHSSLRLDPSSPISIQTEHSTSINTILEHSVLCLHLDNWQSTHAQGLSNILPEPRLAIQKNMYRPCTNPTRSLQNIKILTFLGQQITSKNVCRRTIVTTCRLKRTLKRAHERRNLTR